MLGIVILIYLLLAIYDIRSFILHNSENKVIYFYLITMGISFIINILISLDVKIPSILEFIDSINQYLW